MALLQPVNEPCIVYSVEGGSTAEDSCPYFIGVFSTPEKARAYTEEINKEHKEHFADDTLDYIDEYIWSFKFFNDAIKEVEYFYCYAEKVDEPEWKP